jgi:hypothetical protein
MKPSQLNAEYPAVNRTAISNPAVSYLGHPLVPRRFSEQSRLCDLSVHCSNLARSGCADRMVNES